MSTNEEQANEVRAAAPAPQLRIVDDEPVPELYAALAKAQGVIEPAKKSSKNPHFGSSFADLAAIREACRKPLADNNLCVIQMPVTTARGLELKTTLAHSSGQRVIGFYPVTPMKGDAQGIGSAITYAKRYSLSAMVGVVSEDEDDDGEGAQGRGRNGFDALPHERQRQPEQLRAATPKPKETPRTALPPLPDRITTIPAEILSFIAPLRPLGDAKLQSMSLDALELVIEQCSLFRAKVKTDDGKKWLTAIEAEASHLHGEMAASLGKDRAEDEAQL